MGRDFGFMNRGGGVFGTASTPLGDFDGNGGGGSGMDCIDVLRRECLFC